jgi:hypothetical protein
MKLAVQREQEQDVRKMERAEGVKKAPPKKKPACQCACHRSEEVCRLCFDRSAVACREAQRKAPARIRKLEQKLAEAEAKARRRSTPAFRGTDVTHTRYLELMRIRKTLNAHQEAERNLRSELIQTQDRLDKVIKGWATIREEFTRRGELLTEHRIACCACGVAEHTSWCPYRNPLPELKEKW